VRAVQVFWTSFLNRTIRQNYVVITNVIDVSPIETSVATLLMEQIEVLEIDRLPTSVERSSVVDDDALGLNAVLV